MNRNILPTSVLPTVPYSYQSYEEATEALVWFIHKGGRVRKSSNKYYTYEEDIRHRKEQIDVAFMNHLLLNNIVRYDMYRREYILGSNAVPRKPTL